MANKEEKPEGVKDSSWKEFIYNPRTGEFLGRTASSWGKKTSSKCGAPSFLPSFHRAACVIAQCSLRPLQFPKILSY